MGAERVVVHCGGLSGLPRQDAFANTEKNLRDALDALDAAGLSHIALCVETMGKVNTIGSAEEVAALCAQDARLVPCVDFGHLNARTAGGLQTEGDYAAVFDTFLRHIGEIRTAAMHMHFSKIEYGKGGEIRHLTFDDARFGPAFMPLLHIIAARGWAPRVICESAGTQDADAVTLQAAYRRIKGSIAE
jgi:deoxyribonuclease-4